MLTEVDADEHFKLLQYVKKYLSIICETFTVNQSPESDPSVISLIELLSLVASKFKTEDFMKKLTHEFLQFKEEVVNNV